MKKIIEEAVKIAKGILAEEINPNIGCGKIAELSRKNNAPDEINVFEGLAHEQYGHEEFGITAENTIPNIIEECKNLVNKNS